MTEVAADSGVAAIDDTGAFDEVLSGIAPSAYSIPTSDSKIYKDECSFCYATPYHQGGIFICMKTWTAFCDTHMRWMAEKRGRSVFLHLSSTKAKPPVADDIQEPQVKRLAIGIDDGFCSDKVEVEDVYSLVVFPHVNVHVPLVYLASSPVGVAAERIATTTSAERLALLQGASNAWDGEMKQVTKHANLKQVDNPRQIAPSGWKCDVEGCGLDENLWLNLVDGSIRCGRSQFVSEGVRSKGNNHMKMHYESSGRPLVVKLGTIEASGAADVYSYDEEDAVIDPNLEEHLAHFGLHMKDLTKTEKSTIELELDINQKWEWSKCQEDGENLENAYGPFYTGLINIGSSCYINSVVQALTLMPDFVHRFADGGPAILEAIDPAHMTESVIGQCAKLFSSIASGHFSKPPPNDENNGIRPTQFKNIIGRGHPEFSSSRQQDAEEYIRHVIEKMSEACAGNDPTEAMRFKLQTRLMDNASGRVRYSEKEDVVLSLPVPKTSLVPVDNEATRFSVNLSDCMHAAFAENDIEGFKSPVTGEVKGATTSSAMTTFPDFLVLQVQRFQVADDYSVKKMDIDVIVHDEIDLSAFRGTGPKEDEELLPEDSPSENPLPPFNEEYVSQLEAMGFSRNASIKAVIETKSASADAAAEWVMVRMDLPDLNDPPAYGGNKAGGAAAGPSAESVEQLVSFGFTPHQARYALKKEGDVNGAAEWLFTNADSVPPPEDESAGHAAPHHPTQIRDGSGRYELVSFISHMGSSPHSGHYVCHALKDGKWVLFNDEKVALSKQPPKQLAYLYFYKRI